MSQRVPIPLPNDHSLLLLLHLPFQGLLGPEEPLPGRGRRPLQLSGVVVPADAAVVPEELRQRGVAAPERPLLVVVSGKSQVSHQLCVFIGFGWLALTINALMLKEVQECSFLLRLCIVALIREAATHFFFV